MKNLQAYYKYDLFFDDENNNYSFLPRFRVGSSPTLDNVINYEVHSYINQWSKEQQKHSIEFIDLANDTIALNFEDRYGIGENGIVHVPGDHDDCILYWMDAAERFCFVIYKDGKAQQESLYEYMWDDDFSYDLTNFVTSNRN